MNWTTEPTEPGYYWGRYCGETRLVFYEGYEFGVGIFGERDRPYADEITLWYGPLPEPEPPA